MQGQWTELRGGAPAQGWETCAAIARSLACCEASRRSPRRRARDGREAAAPRACASEMGISFPLLTQLAGDWFYCAQRVDWWLCATLGRMVPVTSTRQPLRFEPAGWGEPKPGLETVPRAPERPRGRTGCPATAAAMADATYGASTPTETETDERTTLIQKRRPRRLRRSVVAASVLVLCGTAVKVRPRVQEYRLGSDVGELGEYPTATWEAINNDSVDKVYDLEEHILVTTEVNDAYVFYKELLFGRLGRATGTWTIRGVRVKSHAYATSAWNTFHRIR